MKFVWNSHFPVSFQETVVTTLSGKFLGCNPEELSLLLKSLSEIRYHWQNKGNMEKTIFSAFISDYLPTEKRIEIDGDSRRFANCVFYLGELSKHVQIDNMDTMVLDKNFLDSIWNGTVKHATKFSPLSIGMFCTG
jgi:hypothetical protein